MAGTAADKAGAQGLIDTLMVFIKQEQAKARGIDIVGDKRHKRADSSWARKYSIQVHSSITTWKAKGDDGGQVQYERQIMRCAFEWQKSEKGWLRDHVWTQEWPAGAKNS